MKTFKTTLALIAATLMALGLLASPSSAATGVDDKPVSGSLNAWDDGAGAAMNPQPSSFETGQVARFQANFASSSAGRTVRLYRVGSSTAVASATANGSGNAYLNYTVVAGDQQLFAETSTDLETETDAYSGTAPAPATATLDQPNDTFGKSWTAHFTPKVNGQSTKLEVREICTYETDETNPETGAFDPDVSQKNCKGPWRTVATSKQNSNGDSTFSIPSKLEVKHTYRASSGTGKSNEVEFAPPLETPNPTGLAQVHFDTYEGDAVNTRSRYFEGQFSMRAGSACSKVDPMMKSVMKGRGNYSWSFPKKSFTLKIDKKTNLCGMGVGKKYALVANDYDKSLLRNSLAGYVGSKLDGLDWTPKSTPVDFYMNGSYRGSYLLIERIAIQGSVTNAYEDPPDTYSNRVNIDELTGDQNGSSEITGGYVLEWDFRKGADYNAYLGSDSGYVGVKEPENDLDREGDNTGNGISSAQKTWIKNYLNTVDNSLRGGPDAWDKYIDRESAIDYYIAMEYLKPVDGNMWASVYMYKPRGEKLHFGPLWDFDLAAGSATRAGNVASSSSFYLKNNLGISAQQDTTNGKTWFNRLNEFPSFRAAVADRWDEIKGSLDTTGYLTTQRNLIEDSAALNFQKWGHSSRISEYQVIKSSWSADVSYLRDWAAARKSWLGGSSGF
jgi:hypothetical protein